ncbi:nicotinamide-nucleotide amidase [Sporosarcina luteola]|nr:nicotinamide-nucleotide amidase [Sporosarcina luteola]
MKAEIIAVGSELLLGQITNTNGAFISQKLAEIGVDIYYHTVVGDNPRRLDEAIAIAQRRADTIIFTGGLGPTKDDLTKETIASRLGVSLVSNEEALVEIKAYFQRTGRLMTDNNKKQALVLEGSCVLPNRHGMAPGMALEKDGIRYILLPGPPHEMKPMFEQEAIPFLLGMLGTSGVIASRVLKFYGIGEAELEDRVQSILDKQLNPTVAPLASPDAVTLRLTAKAESLAAAEQLMAPVENEIREMVGEFLYGIDEDTLSSKAAELLLNRGLSVAAAESLTAGLFLAELAGEAGISAALKGGVIVYDKEAKIEQLDISRTMLDQYGIVSKECAAALAMQVKTKFNSDIGIGLTGVAGPEPHDNKPAGIIWIGIALYDGTVETYKLSLSGSRNSNRRRAAHYALYYLIKHLQ